MSLFQKPQKHSLTVGISHMDLIYQWIWRRNQVGSTGDNIAEGLLLLVYCARCMNHLWQVLPPLSSLTEGEHNTCYITRQRTHQGPNEGQLWVSCRYPTIGALTLTDATAHRVTPPL